MTKSFKIYGYNGHRQRQSFGKTESYDFSTNEVSRIIKIVREDVTKTNEYVILEITRDTEEEIKKELAGQLSDGFFENCRVGKIEEED